VCTEKSQLQVGPPDETNTRACQHSFNAKGMCVCVCVYVHRTRLSNQKTLATQEDATQNFIQKRLFAIFKAN